MRGRLRVSSGDSFDSSDLQGALISLSHTELDVGRAGEVAVGSNLDALLTAHAEKFGLLKVSVHLDLEDSGLDLGVGKDLVEESRVDV